MSQLSRILSSYVLSNVSLPVSLNYDLLHDDVVVIVFGTYLMYIRELLEPSLIKTEFSFLIVRSTGRNASFSTGLSALIRSEVLQPTARNTVERASWSKSAHCISLFFVFDLRTNQELVQGNRTIRRLENNNNLILVFAPSDSPRSTFSIVHIADTDGFRGG